MLCIGGFAVKRSFVSGGAASEAPLEARVGGDMRVARLRMQVRQEGHFNSSGRARGVVEGSGWFVFGFVTLQEKSRRIHFYQAGSIQFRAPRCAGCQASCHLNNSSPAHELIVGRAVERCHPWEGPIAHCAAPARRALLLSWLVHRDALGEDRLILAATTVERLLAAASGQWIPSTFALAANRRTEGAGRARRRSAAPQAQLASHYQIRHPPLQTASILLPSGSSRKAA